MKQTNYFNNKIEQTSIITWHFYDNIYIHVITEQLHCRLNERGRE